MDKSQTSFTVDAPTALIDREPPRRPAIEPIPPKRARRTKRDYLETEHLVKDIGTRSVQGGLATLLSQHAKAVIDIAAQLALARLLLPSDFGVVAMVVVITRFAMLLTQLGLRTATVQAEKVTNAQISTLFWVNVFVGASLAVLLVAVSPLVSLLYGEPRIIGIFAVLAFSVVFGSLSVQHEALLRRQMHFKALAVCGVIAVGFAAIVALVLAVSGSGYWSLVMMHLTYAVTMTTCVWIACKWRPRWTPDFAGVRSILAFGGRLTGFDLFDYASRNVDRVLVGLFWGARWLGLYAQAVELFLTSTRQVCMPVSEVTITGLSRLQSERGQFRSYFLNAFSFVLVIAMPIAVLFGVLAPELLVTVLGERWLDAAPILQLLSICALIYPMTQITLWLYKATGRGRQMLRWGIFSSLASVGAFLIGIPYGVEAMATSFTICTGVLIVPCVHFATRDTGITNGDVWKTFVPPFTASLLAAIVGASIKYFVTYDWPAWATLLSGGGAIITTYALILLYALGMKSQLVSFWQALRSHKAVAQQP